MFGNQHYILTTPTLSLPVGFKSDGKPFCIETGNTNLFISYSEEAQYDHVLQQLFAAIEKSGHHYILQASPYAESDSIEPGLLSAKKTDVSQAAIFTTLFGEYIRRKKMKISPEPKPGEQMNKDILQLFVVVKDIWSLLILAAKKKIRTKQLLTLLVEGPSVGIFFIAGSRLSFKKLLQQLIEGNERILQKLPQHVPMQNAKGVAALGDELVITPDDITYYRKQFSMQYTGLY